MNFTGSVILLITAAALLYFGRARGGDALPVLQNYLVGTLFSFVLLVLFMGGLFGVIKNWPL